MFWSSPKEFDKKHFVFKSQTVVSYLGTIPRMASDRELFRVVSRCPVALESFVSQYCTGTILKKGTARTLSKKGTARWEY